MKTLADIQSIITPKPEDEEGVCLNCGRFPKLRDGCDPTPLCDECCQEMLPELLRIAEQLQKEKEDWKGLADLKDAKGEANRTENNKLLSTLQAERALRSAEVANLSMFVARLCSRDIGGSAQLKQQALDYLLKNNLMPSPLR